MTRARKPRLTLFEFQCLMRLHQEIVERDYRGETLGHAASDLYDGWLKPEEVRGLIRKRLFLKIPIPAGEGPGNDLLGDRMTVHLTDRAIRVFWPDRRATP
jgi:hypothetical protein